MFIDLLNEEVRIKGYTDPNVIGLKGRVVSETQKTLLLLLPDGRKARIMKAHVVLEKRAKEKNVSIADVARELIGQGLQGQAQAVKCQDDAARQVIRMIIDLLQLYDMMERENKS